MKKVGFVIPWFGEKIPGGAEMELRGLSYHLHQSGMDIEILTTCVKEFSSDWSENFYSEGLEMIGGVPVRRFKVKSRNRKIFDEINYRLMKGDVVSREDEEKFFEEMVNSPKLYEYINQKKDEYALFVYIPYMFSTTYYGVKACPEKAVMIPCLHDECYAHLSLFKELFPKIKGLVFNAQPEYELANRIYDISNVKTAVFGIGMDTNVLGDGERFKEKYKIRAPYILYAGRKDVGKNVDTLLKYFNEYKSRISNDIKLVLIGGGEIEIPGAVKNDVYDLGFLPIQDKYDAYAGSTLLCQPSKFESFSLVIMESWLNRKPVLVYEFCEVTKHFAKDSNGGLYFSNYFEFEGCVEYILNHPKQAAQMGKNGENYVRTHFSWEVVVDNYTAFFKQLC